MLSKVVIFSKYSGDKNIQYPFLYALQNMNERNSKIYVTYQCI